ncbi:MAG: hypothetical protein KA807_20280 [Prolixibacteraceae bacterium]|nr:hypothetical protein [Prolixibacteraceae bacterium]
MNSILRPMVFGLGYASTLFPAPLAYYLGWQFKVLLFVPIDIYAIFMSYINHTSL